MCFFYMITTVYLGAYDDEETAAHAYDLAALKYWGPDTILNFPVHLFHKFVNALINKNETNKIISQL